jgi:hypothetical protein
MSVGEFCFRSSHTTEDDTGFMYKPIFRKTFCFFVIDMLCVTRHEDIPILARCDTI